MWNRGEYGVRCAVVIYFFPAPLHIFFYRQYILLLFLVTTTICSARTGNFSVNVSEQKYFFLGTKCCSKNKFGGITFCSYLDVTFFFCYIK